jgi:hypothetical protein
MANQVAVIYRVISKRSTVSLAHDAQTLRQRCFSAFAKLRKATISLIVFVCPSVRMKQLGSHWTDFH